MGDDGTAAVAATDARHGASGGEVVVVCPGSFDPLHNGHLDVVGRAAARVDRVVLAVIENPSKVGSEMFTIDERVELARTATRDLGNVEVDRFRGLLVEYCRQHGIGLILKGLRGSADFEYELQMAQMNTRMTGVETLFIPTAPAYGSLSSSLIKEIARLGGEVDWMVPPSVLGPLRERAG